MTIKEQLSDSIYNAETESIPNSALYNIDVKLASELCEQVVSDTAIRFAEWLWTDSHLKSEGIFMTITMKELFELFKKENKL